MVNLLLACTCKTRTFHAFHGAETVIEPNEFTNQ